MIDASGIHALLPHRYPMLLVDRVDVIEPGVRLQAVKAVSVNEPWYAGFFGTGNAGTEVSYPMALLVESWSRGLRRPESSRVSADRTPMCCGTQ